LILTYLFAACYRCYDQEEEEAVESRIACVKALVEAGANINYIKNRTNLTALHWAAFNDDKAVVKLLLRHGANLYYSSTDETPIDIAGLCENYDVNTFGVR
jgi:ankyrin repeat protein